MQHEDGHSHILSSTVPNCVSYDPTFAYEVAVIIQDGLRRMVGEQEDVYYYITLMNENYEHPALPEGAEQGTVKGMYLFKGGEAGGKEQPRVQLLGSGTILREVIAAADLLREYGVAADIWSCPSFTELRREGLEAERWNLLHPDQPPRKSYVEQCLAGRGGPVVASTDYMKAFADGIRAFVPGRYKVLGTDGYGRSDYTAAFRAADLGKKVVLVERRPSLGGVCLNVGCIPSKALLHAAKVITETEEMGAHGIRFAKPEVDIDALRGWKDGVVKKLTGGLGGLARQRKVQVVHGTGHFTAPNQVLVEGDDGTATTVGFDRAIIAAGSEPVTLPFIPHEDPRVIDSTGALELDGVPACLLVVGGGIIGLEMATVYHALGTAVTVVELMDQIIPGADRDMVTPLMKRISKQYAAIHLKTKVTKIEAGPDGLTAHFEGDGAPPTAVFDKVLVAVGRKPNGRLVGAENAGVRVDERGYIPVDKQMRTNVGHIFAIGDVVGQPMLAHKATHEGKVAAEVAAGKNSAFDARVIPSVAYTDPEVAWVGLTENEAKAKGIQYGKGVFPWAASGRSLALGRDEGLTKVLFDAGTERIIGCGITGPSAGDLIAEAALAIEMGADATDIGATIHPHPTLFETVGMAAEAFEGTITDLYMPKKH